LPYKNAIARVRNVQEVPTFGQGFGGAPIGTTLVVTKSLTSTIMMKKSSKIQLCEFVFL
jgi:hypothetical protein